MFFQKSFASGYKRIGGRQTFLLCQREGGGGLAGIPTYSLYEKQGWGTRS